VKWSWNIGRLAGIELRIHATFVLLIAWVGASCWMANQSIGAVLAGVVFMLALFSCVVLHEMGHALAAKRFGVPTKDITLLPIGGVARLERMPEEPSQELWIALAGPAVNVALAALLYGWLSFKHEWEPLSRLHVATGPFFERLLVANISLVLFNLIPAFPMDGGRILRAILAWRMPHLRATRIASQVGQGLAFVLGATGLFTNPMLILIALFVWLGASQEAASVEMKAALSGTPVREVMLTDFETLRAGDTLAAARSNRHSRDRSAISQCWTGAASRVF
jgi:Zn-dependent protease